VLTRIHAADPHVQVIRFRRNFGQTAAFAAGFAAARGTLIITADPRTIRSDRATFPPC
jgi:hypothetical protein